MRFEFQPLAVGSKGEQSASHSAYVRREEGVAEFVDYGEWYFWFRPCIAWLRGKGVNDGDFKPT